MRNQRSFNLEFKRQVVEELLSGESRPAQLCRRHNIGASLLYHWKKQYSRGKFNNEPTCEAALKDRIDKLERLVGRLTLENEFLKKRAPDKRQSASEKREIITRCKHFLSSIRQGCRLMNLARSSFYHKSRARNSEWMAGKP